MKQKLEIKGVKGSNFNSGTLLTCTGNIWMETKTFIAATHPIQDLCSASPIVPPCDPQHFAAILLKKLASVVPCLNRWQFMAFGIVQSSFFTDSTVPCLDSPQLFSHVLKASLNQLNDCKSMRISDEVLLCRYGTRSIVSLKLFQV